MPNSQKVYPIGWEIFDEKKRISAFRRKKERKRKVSEIVAEKRESDKTYSIGQGIMLAGTVLLLIAVIIAFLYQSQKLKQNIHNTSVMAEQYEELVSDNDDLKKQIEADIDYEAIYDRAVHEFGMTYPKKNQVVGFEKGEQSYVRQGESVP